MSWLDQQGWALGLAALGAGAVVGVVAQRVALAVAPGRLMRTNVNGRRIPAILGLPLAIAAVASVFVVTLVRSLSGAIGQNPLVAAATVVLVVLIMFLGGLVDDLWGDEEPRGFSGHLAALRSGRISGGIVKIAAGGLAGVAAAVVLDGGPLRFAETVLLVALTANLYNLLDRAPGRAAKTGLVAAVPLALASPQWGVAAAGLLGALLVVLPADLHERAMLGDAGANPIGAVIGVGVAGGLGEPWRVLLLLTVLALNLASERISFSRVIDDTRWLRALDRLGRK